MADGGRDGSGADARTQPRTLLEFPVRVEFATSREALESITGDLSRGGMFVSDENPKPIGTMVRFEVASDGGQPVRGLGEVAWIRVRWEGHDRPAGMGIQFRSLGKEALELIDRMIVEAAQRAPAHPRPSGGARPLPLIPPPPSPDGIEPLRPDPPPRPKRPPKAAPKPEEAAAAGPTAGAKGEKAGATQKLFADIRTKKKGGAKKGATGEPSGAIGGIPRRTYALLGILALLLLLWMC